MITLKTDAERKFFDKVGPYIHRLKSDMKCGKWDACVVLGAAGHESKGLTDMQEDKPTVPGSRGGYGWMQWTGPRRKEYEAFCARHKLNAASDEANYQFMVHELKNTYESKVMAALFKVSAFDDKVEVFEKEYLRSGVKNWPSRQRWAQVALAAYNKYLDDIGADEPIVPTPAPTPVPPPLPRPPVSDTTKKGGIVAGIIAALAAIGYAIGKGIGIW